MQIADSRLMKSNIGRPARRLPMLLMGRMIGRFREGKENLAYSLLNYFLSSNLISIPNINSEWWHPDKHSLQEVLQQKTLPEPYKLLCNVLLLFPKVVFLHHLRRNQVIHHKRWSGLRLAGKGTMVFYLYHQDVPVHGCVWVWEKQRTIQTYTNLLFAILDPCR